MNTALDELSQVVTAAQPTLLVEPAGVDEVAPVTDAELLCQFSSTRDSRAFTELVTRHGGLVLAVCRRLLGSQHDAEDAFQATFMVLARKASSLRSGSSLPAWLHKTAFRLALRAKAGRNQRREQPLEVEQMIAPQALEDIATTFEQSLLDQELNQLPERYRLPVFMCCVEGLSLEAVARQLGWTLGSVKGRLERGRQLLRRRLLLQRVSLSIGLTSLAFATSAQAASLVPASLVATTVQASLQFAAGHSAAGLVSQHALSLAQGSLQLMSSATAKVLGGSLLGVGLLFGGAAQLPASAFGSGTGQPAEPPALALAGLLELGDTDSALAFFDGEGAKKGPRDGEGVKPGPRDGEAQDPNRPRDGEGIKPGPRDGEGVKKGPKEGDAPKKGMKEGDAPKKGEREVEGVKKGGERDANRNDFADDFKPETAREEKLLDTIQRLKRELAELRDEKYERKSEGRKVNPEQSPQPPRKPGTLEYPDDPNAFKLPENWKTTKEGQVFVAYDQDGDLAVSVSEWLRMKGVDANDTKRVERETERFKTAEPSGDEKMTPAEFIYWYGHGRFDKSEKSAESKAE